MSETTFTADTVKDTGIMPAMIKQWGKVLAVDLKGNNRENIAVLLNQIKTKGLAAKDLPGSLVDLARKNGVFPPKAVTVAATDPDATDGTEGTVPQAAPKIKAQKAAGATPKPASPKPAGSAKSVKATPAATKAETAPVKKEENLPKAEVDKRWSAIMKADKDEETFGASWIMTKGAAYSWLQKRWAGADRRVEGEEKKLKIDEYGAKAHGAGKSKGTTRQTLAKLAKIYRAFAKDDGTVDPAILARIKTIGVTKMKEVVRLPQPHEALNEGVKVGGKLIPLEDESLSCDQLTVIVNEKIKADSPKAKETGHLGRKFCGKDYIRLYANPVSKGAKVRAAKEKLEDYTAADRKALKATHDALVKDVEHMAKLLAAFDAE